MIGSKSLSNLIGSIKLRSQFLFLVIFKRTLLARLQSNKYPIARRKFSVGSSSFILLFHLVPCFLEVRY
jgi:hypothetical protein